MLLSLPALGLLVFAALVAARDPQPPPPRAPAAAPAAPARPEPRPSLPAAQPEAPRPAIRWRRSLALGQPGAGRLVRGVQLPARGRLFRTWDPVLKRSPNRPWRRWGTDRLVRPGVGGGPPHPGPAPRGP